MNSDKFDTILLNLIKSDSYRVMVDNVGAQVQIRNGRIIVDVFEPESKSYDLSGATKFSVTNGYIQCCLNSGEWHELEIVKKIDPSELLG
jgi:hypothetical protein